MTTLSKMFVVALVAIVMGSLGGCTTKKFEVIGKPITIGDKTYTAMGTEWVNPCAGNALSLHLVETEQSQCAQVQVAQPVHYDHQSEMRTPEHTHAQEHPGRTQQYVMSSDQGNTRVVNNNNSATTGIINGAFQGSVQGAFQATGMIVGAGRIRPSNVSAGGGSASASSSSAAAAAASGTP